MAHGRKMARAWAPAVAPYAEAPTEAGEHLLVPLLARHTHAGQLFAAGDWIRVRPAVADWLLAHGVIDYRVDPDCPVAQYRSTQPTRPQALQTSSRHRAVRPASSSVQPPQPLSAAKVPTPISNSDR